MASAINDRSSIFIQHLEAGEICLHPTDTIPGLTCHPFQEKAVEKLGNVKGWAERRPMLGLVSSLANAITFWQALPAPWNEVLAELWPGSLTVVWKAKAGTPPCLVSTTGEMALRCPSLGKEKAWLAEVLKTLTFPLPSTSVNKAGEEPIVRGDDLARFCGAQDVWTPPLDLFSAKEGRSSTIIRIKPGGVATWIRKGALSQARIEHQLKRSA
ncbi:MAG: Sua5/YciO/YrdC/YwlC family protein [Deltaproteobacteria bacterium]|nr:Sua5/YciO/YrdC/YwlC family protein [Deltaproteobacteria bacterium]